jgi:DNA invertase Pin-like site-specific DNA recombinase
MRKTETAHQRKALKVEGYKVFYEEEMNGKNTDSLELQCMLSELNDDDVLLVIEISRLSRSLKDSLA